METKLKVIDIKKFRLKKAHEKLNELYNSGSSEIMIVGVDRADNFFIKCYTTLSDNDTIYVIEKIKNIMLR